MSISPVRDGAVPAPEGNPAGILASKTVLRRRYGAFTTAVFLAAAIAVPAYLYLTRDSRLAAASIPGRLYGLLGALLFAVLIGYPLRKLVYRGRAGSLEHWYRLHLSLGVLCLVVVGCHAGLSFRSVFLVALQIGFLGVVLSGIACWAAPWWFVSRLERDGYPDSQLAELELRHDKVLTALEERQKQLAVELENRRQPPDERWKSKDKRTTPEIEANLHALTSALAKPRELPAHYLSGRRPWSYWLETSQSAFQSGVLPDLDNDSRLKFVELHQVEVLRFYHRWLRSWPTWHLLFGIFAIQMVAWHIWWVTFFPR